MFEKEKERLRKQLLERRKDQADKHMLSENICDRAAKLVRGNVLIYISIGSEVETGKLVSILKRRRDVRIFAPRTSSEGIIAALPLIKEGRPDGYGNLPYDCYDMTDNEKSEIDFCITPLVGFNGCGYRIGYGKGCYDRFFARCRAYKIGLAFECQYVDFAREEFDVPLDCCVTQRNVIYFNNASDCGKIQGN